MKEKCISVIIPVYNCEKYISRCLKSIINQTYKNLQIIVVDDGSFDDSLRICNEFANKDARIEVYHKENGGVSSARNLGLKKVKGDYVSFIDADDFLELNMFSTMVKNIKNEEIIVCNFNNIDENGNKISGIDIPDMILDKNNALKELFLNRYIIGALWNKLFDYDLLKNLEFNINYTVGEDLLYEFLAINNSRKIRFISDCLYNYYINDNNATSKVSYTKWKQIIDICEIIKNETNDKKLLDYLKIKKFKSYRLIMNKMIKQQLNKKDLIYLKEILLESKNYFKYYITNKDVDLRDKIFTIVLLFKANKMVRKKRSVNVYLKAYLSKNLGDDLFIYLLLNRYNNVNYSVLSRYSKYEAFPSIKLIKRGIIDKLIKIISLRKDSYENILAKKNDFAIILGGSMFMEQSSSNKEKYFVDKDKEYYILGSNFGPYNSKEYYNKFYKVFSKAKDVCFRDKYSYNLFNKLPNVRCASDIVFSLDTNKISIKNQKKVVISVIDCNKKINSKYTEIYERKIIDLIKLFYAKDYEITLMSYCKSEGDEFAIERIISKLDDEKIRKNINKYFYNGNIEEALNVMGDCKVIVGTRFHANILGLVMNKTIIPIAYSDKTLNVLNDMNFKGKVFDIRDMDNFNVDSLTDNDLNYKLDVSYQKKDAQRQFEKLDEVLERKE